MNYSSFNARVSKIALLALCTTVLLPSYLFARTGDPDDHPGRARTPTAASSQHVSANGISHSGEQSEGASHTTPSQPSSAATGSGDFDDDWEDLYAGSDAEFDMTESHPSHASSHPTPTASSYSDIEREDASQASPSSSISGVEIVFPDSYASSAVTSSVPSEVPSNLSSPSTTPVRSHNATPVPSSESLPQELTSSLPIDRSSQFLSSVQSSTNSAASPSSTRRSTDAFQASGYRQGETNPGVSAALPRTPRTLNPQALDAAIRAQKEIIDALNAKNGIVSAPKPAPVAPVPAPVPQPAPPKASPPQASQSSQEESRDEFNRRWGATAQKRGGKLTASDEAKKGLQNLGRSLGFKKK